MIDSASNRSRDLAFGLPEMDPRDQPALTLLGHDLRAALSDVVGGLRLIEPASLEPTTRVQIERVRAASEVLARLLEQALTVMLGEADASVPENVNLIRYLTDLDLRWSGRALEKGIGFTLMHTADLPLRLMADRVALDRVLSNLLGNAFKYCEQGNVLCEVSLPSDGWLAFSVRDDGPGFPPSMFGRQPAFHGRPPGMTKPGSGMGLHIATDLVTRMGGKLTLRNLDPRGAEARVDLPLVVSDLADPDLGDTEPFLCGKRVLIADDNPTSQAIISRLATSLGAEVVVVSDGVETVGRLEREAFDLLIVDVEMPRLSGLDVIRCLRGMHGAVARMPVVAVTAYTMRANRQAILAAGANDMLSKPLLCPRAFAATLRGVMQAEAGYSATAKPQTAPPPDIDHGRLHRLLAMAGPETGRDLLDRLVSDLTGVERGLVKAGSTVDWEAIRHHTHVLISLAGAVGGLSLQAEAEALNQLANRADRSSLGGGLSRVLILLDAIIQFVNQVRDQPQTPVR